MTTNIKKVYTLLMALAFLVSCNSLPENPTKSNRLPKIFPDYTGVTVPVGIAPSTSTIRAATARRWMSW